MSRHVTEPHKGSRAGQADATLVLYSELTQQLVSLSAAATIDGAVCGVRGVLHHGLKSAEAFRTHTHTHTISAEHPGCKYTHTISAEHPGCKYDYLTVYSAVQCYAVQCTTVLYSAVQYSAVQCSAVTALQQR